MALPRELVTKHTEELSISREQYVDAVESLAMCAHMNNESIKDLMINDDTFRYEQIQSIIAHAVITLWNIQRDHNAN